MTECHDRRKEKREESAQKPAQSEVRPMLESPDESFICLEIYSQRLLALSPMLFA